MEMEWVTKNWLVYALSIVLTAAFFMGIVRLTEPALKRAEGGTRAALRSSPLLPESGGEAPGVLIKTVAWVYEVGHERFQVAAEQDTTVIPNDFTALSHGRPVPVSSISLSETESRVLVTHALP